MKHKYKRRNQYTPTSLVQRHGELSATLGTLLSKYRLEKGLSQATLADKVNMSRGQYSRIESGYRHVDAIEFAKLCVVLDAQELFSYLCEKLREKVI